ncbi:hypothetical protein B0W48_02195 [Pseudoalteromonas aliena]|uniref:Uncharacterized protein n=1 Tax=Pseudoalteromonas aliena TaxID=247523 RepID=A0A1Q2GUB6_9GAMM|nr:hypothetical protein B0W48_02195 [Pseudoalteromonas aliena]
MIYTLNANIFTKRSAVFYVGVGVEIVRARRKGFPNHFKNCVFIRQQAARLQVIADNATGLNIFL